MNIHLSHIHSLSSFQRNVKQTLRELKASGKPTVLTVNGQAEVVIQNAQAYQRLLDDHETLKTLRAIQQGLDQAKRGEGKPMRSFLKELAKEYRAPLK